MKRLFFLLLAFACLTMSAQTPTKREVIIDCAPDENDPAGRDFCRQLRDEIAKSPRYTEIHIPRKNWGKDHLIVRSVTTVADKSGLSTAIATVFLVGETYINHGVRVCGMNRTEKCAVGTLSDLDESIEQMLKN